MIQPRFMLDTDTVSFSLKRRYPSLGRRIEALDVSDYCISVVTRAELLFGLYQIPADHPSQGRVRQFLTAVTILAWDQTAADTYARLRHQLSVQGMPLADMDLLIAAHAISLGAVLVTNNTRHFGRLAPLLTIENWVDET